MASDVDIANMALGHLGTRATISSMTENSTEAREINRWYAQVRESLLRQLDWNFARVTATLALTGTAPTRWSYSYAYPSDCLKFWRLDLGDGLYYPTEPRAKFEIGSDGTDRYVWCNIDQAVGVYTQRVTNPALFDPEFTTAFAVSLAAMVAYAITNKQDLATRLEGKAASLIERAKADNANEAVTNERERLAESLTVRGYDTAPNESWPWMPVT